MVLPCTLSRTKGSLIAARIIELSLSGVRVVTPRPLALDETLVFELSYGDLTLQAGTRVIRQERPDLYALRFSALPKPTLKHLHDIITIPHIDH